MNILSLLTPKEQTTFLNSKVTIRQVLEKFDYYKFTVVPLLDEEGHYIATVSEGDILRFIKNNCNFDLKMAEEQLVVNLDLYRPYNALHINCTIKDVILLAMDQNFIPMIDDRGVFIGIIKRKDIIKYFYQKRYLDENNGI